MSELHHRKKGGGKGGGNNGGNKMKQVHTSDDDDETPPSSDVSPFPSPSPSPTSAKTSSTFTNSRRTSSQHSSSGLKKSFSSESLSSFFSSPFTLLLLLMIVLQIISLSFTYSDHLLLHSHLHLHSISASSSSPQASSTSASMSSSSAVSSSALDALRSALNQSIRMSRDERRHLSDQIAALGEMLEQVAEHVVKAVNKKHQQQSNGQKEQQQKLQPPSSSTNQTTSQPDHSNASNTTVAGPPPPAVEGNAGMRLTAEEYAALHAYRNFTVSPAGEIIDGGSSLNQTEVLLRSIGQLGPSGETVDLVVQQNNPLDHDDRTVVSGRFIHEGEYFWRIPLNLILTSFAVDDSPIGHALMEAQVERDEMLWLGVFILFEKFNKYSPWKFLLDTWPRTYDHMPTLLSNEELDLISGTVAKEWIETYQKDHRSEYQVLCEVLDGAGLNFSNRFTFAQFIWARNAVNSRAFSLHVSRNDMTSSEQRQRNKERGEEYEDDDEKVHINAIIPADLVNHEGETRKIDCIWGYNLKTQEFAFKAVRDIPPGTVMHTTYGARGNSDLYVHYGFTLAHNPNNAAIMCLHTNTSDALALLRKKQSVLKEVFSVTNVSGCKGRLLTDGTESLVDEAPMSLMAFHCNPALDATNHADSKECLSFMRIAAANELEFKRRIMPIWEKELREKEAERKERRALRRAQGLDPGDGEEDAASSTPSALLTLAPLGFDHEVRAVTFLGQLAARSAAVIAGGSASEDKTILDAHEEAVKNGQCSPHASHSSSSDNNNTWPSGPCLTLAQLNLLRVRFGEKYVLENYHRIGEAAASFQDTQCDSVEACFDFLERFLIPPEELARLQREDITPDYSVVEYLNEVLLPLYFHAKGWIGVGTQRTSSHGLSRAGATGVATGTGTSANPGSSRASETWQEAQMRIRRIYYPHPELDIEMENKVFGAFGYEEDTLVTAHATLTPHVAASKA